MWYIYLPDNETAFAFIFKIETLIAGSGEATVISTVASSTVILCKINYDSEQRFCSGKCYVKVKNKIRILYEKINYIWIP